MVGLDDSLRAALGGRSATVLANALDLHTVGDLLRHYPRRYVERGELTDLASLTVGEHVTVLAKVDRVNKRRMRNRSGTLLEVIVTDGRGKLVLTFFKQPWRERELLPGRHGLFAGKVSLFGRNRQLTHPDYQLLEDTGDTADTAGEVSAFAGALIPVYPAAASLPSWRVAKCVRVVLDSLDAGTDPLPGQVRARHGLMGLHEALHGIHRPETYEDVRRAGARLRWDEAFTLQVALARARQASSSVPALARPGRPGGLLATFDERLPFTLTTGQRAVGAQLADELADEHPMHRLLQGEVGAGKTLIALRGMLQVIDSGGQAALLAPTEVLAAQHARSIRELLGPLGRAGELGSDDHATRVALLTGSLGAAARRRALLEAASGDAGIVVGTHALLQERVRFADLGLVVVDEQHRFGVQQRDALRDKAAEHRPHLLVMTATPIPRTVAMTVYGDLETSSLSELPAGRAPVTTHVVPASDKPAYLARAWERLGEEIDAGRQAYVVCPRVGDTEAETDDGTEAETDDGTEADTAARVPGEPDGNEGDPDGHRPPLAVLDVAPELAEGPLASRRVEMVHGRLPSDRKEQTMRRFATGDIDVLVATTVVEVGVDVPNASTMVIMDADRFGVSQLHQLRGRVGRGSNPGLCLLVTDAPAGSSARARLDAVAETMDGFALSRVDLQQRREGDVLGATQSGRRSGLALLQLLRDEEIIRLAREEATTLVADDPELDAHQALAVAVERLLGADRGEYLEKG